MTSPTPPSPGSTALCHTSHRPHVTHCHAASLGALHPLLWLAVKLLRGYAARMLPPATPRTLTLVTNRCQCSGQFTFPAVFSASLSSPFPIQHLNWVRTNVAHLRLGINKQSVWREQESRIHFATQKKFNVNKQCITTLSTLHLWLTTTCLIQPNSWWTLWTRPSIMMAAARTPQRENVHVTCQLTDAEVTVYPSNLATMLLQLTSSP